MFKRKKQQLKSRETMLSFVGNINGKSIVAGVTLPHVAEKYPKY